MSKIDTDDRHSATELAPLGAGGDGSAVTGGDPRPEIGGIVEATWTRRCRQNSTPQGAEDSGERGFSLPGPVGADGTVVCELIWCPQLPAGTRYELIRNEPGGARVSLAQGRLEEPAPSLNLAHLRRQGATLGADEVVLILPQGCDGLAAE